VNSPDFRTRGSAARTASPSPAWSPRTPLPGVKDFSGDPPVVPLLPVPEEDIGHSRSLTRQAIPRGDPRVTSIRMSSGRDGQKKTLAGKPRSGLTKDAIHEHTVQLGRRPPQGLLTRPREPYTVSPSRRISAGAPGTGGGPPYPSRPPRVSRWGPSPEEWLPRVRAATVRSR